MRRDVPSRQEQKQNIDGSCARRDIASGAGNPVSRMAVIG
jgi:hypothetical protein